MKFKSEVLTQASGSIGGVTYAHNVGGLYRRARSIPVNPNSAAQLSARTNFGDASIRWRETLTGAQRDAWSAYAALSPITNVFGDPLQLSGQQMYVRCNSVRRRAGESFVDAGPILSGLIQLSECSGNVDTDGESVNVTFDETDAWVDMNSGGLSIQTSRYLSPSINFFRGPFRFLNSVPGSSTLPPTAAADLGSANAFGQDSALAPVGSNMYMRATAYADDGRISATQIFVCDITTP